MKTLLSMITGAILMYFLDPRTGTHRRHLLQDKINKLKSTTSDYADGLSEEITNRSTGVVHETAKKFTTDEPVSDDKLEARARSEMGRYVSHPAAVEITSDDGVVTLTGKILASEVQPFIKSLKSMANVKKVNNELEVHESAEGIPELQGGRTRPELR